MVKNGKKWKTHWKKSKKNDTSSLGNTNNITCETSVDKFYVVYMHGGKIETIFYLVGNVSYISNLGITIFLILYSNHLIRVLLRHLAADCRTISVRRPFRFRSQMVSVAG